MSCPLIKDIIYMISLCMTNQCIGINNYNCLCPVEETKKNRKNSQKDYLKKQNRVV